MLTLILGRAKTGKTAALLQAVRDCPAAVMASRIVIVPEQLSHQTERQLSAIGGDRISFVSEVLSFTRLASRVFSICGGGARQSLDKGGRLLTARLALDSIHSQLKVFAAAASRADFLDSMVNMIDELKTYNVTPDRLREASRQVEGAFAQKLLELSLILGAYNAAMSQGTCDPRDKLTLLARKLRETDYAASRYFFVDGFTDFSQQELDVLELLISKSCGVTVALPCDSVPDGESLFDPGRETASRLLRMAASLGQETRVVFAEQPRDIPAELRYLEQNLFRYQAPAFQGACRAVTLTEAADPLTECRHCAASLKQAAMQGTRWRDMMVAAGDTQRYGPLMEAVCREYGIPLYTGMRTPITAQPAVAFLLCALEAAAEGMDTDTVLAYLRTGYSGVTPDECDALENYAYTWAIRGSKWQKTWTEHPEGYDGRFTGETQAQLDSLNELRQRAVGPLLRLSTGLKNAGNTRGQIEAVYRFLEEVQLWQQVSAQLEELTTRGQQEAAQELGQVYNTLLECLQQTVSVLGQTAHNSGELLRILQLALSQYDIGTIPASLDAVHFGAVEAVRGCEPRRLWVLGLNEGSVPHSVSGGSLLTELERSILLNRLDISLAPDSEGALKRELFQIYCAFSAPMEGLHLSYPAGEAGESLQPSFLAERIRSMFPDLALEKAVQSPADAMTPEGLAELYLVAEDQGQTDLAAAIRRTAREVPSLEQKIIDAKSASLPRELKVSRQLTQKLFGQPVALTASRLDELGNCPLSFFLNYGLKARPRKQASFDAAEYGTFLHYILEKTVGHISREDVPLPLTEEQSAALVSSHMGSYLEERMQDAGELSAREQYLYHRNQQEAAQLLQEISQEFSVSRFRPCAFELQFGDGKDLAPLEVQGKLGTGHLDGMVDRADLWDDSGKEYLRIVDYKSGTKKFDYTDLTGGVGMQMLLYLFALEQAGIQGVSEHPVPAGVLYFPAKRNILGSEEPLDEESAEKLRRKEGPKRSGLLLADETVLDAMEQGIEGQYLPVQKKKNGFGDYAVTPEQMEILKDFVKKRMGQAVDQIVDGCFNPSPFYRGQSHDPCRWCDYGDICQKDQKFRREHYVPPVKAEDFWNLIGGDDNG